MSRPRAMATLRLLSLLPTWTEELLECRVPLPLDSATITTVQDKGVSGPSIFFLTADFLFYLQQPAAAIPLLQVGHTCISLPYCFAPTLLSFQSTKSLGPGPVSAAHSYRVSQGGPCIQLRAFKGQCNYYSVEISCVPRSCKPICLHRNVQISALFSVHAQLAAHILSSY